MSVKILDCTLRDGGYYNNWDFDLSVVKNYLYAMKSSKVDAIEIGFRFMPKNKFLGPYAYSSDEFLSTLPLPKDSLIGIMINASDLLNYEGGSKAAVAKLLNPASASPVGLVRIAAHFKEVASCCDAAKEIKKLGYKVGFNIMQISNGTPAEISASVEMIKSWNAVDILYFADSLGNLDVAAVSQIVEAIQSSWNGQIGFHGHDNMSLAMVNSSAAVARGVEWIDGTILGMGRGAGNTKTENLLLEAVQKEWGDYHPEGVFPIVMGEFAALQREYQWGPSLPYYLSAQYGIHPTYVQEMVGNVQYGQERILSTLEYLRSIDGKSFKQDALRQSLFQNTGNFEGTWSAEKWIKNEIALIVGPGPSTQKYSEAIKNFILKNKPTVISLNINESISEELIDAYAACHQMRLLMDVEKYKHIKKPLLLPLGCVPKISRSQLSDVKVYDYGMKVEEGTLSSCYSYCTIPYPLVAPYVLSAAAAGGAKTIFMVGFDGYSAGDPRQSEMEDILALFHAKFKSVDLISITPTTYTVKQSSVFAPSN